MKQAQDQTKLLSAHIGTRVVEASADTIQFPGQIQVVALDNGRCEPLPRGNDGSQSANFGAAASSLLTIRRFIRVRDRGAQERGRAASVSRICELFHRPLKPANHAFARRRFSASVVSCTSAETRKHISLSGNHRAAAGRHLKF